MIRVNHLSKRFGPHTAVDDLSFVVGEGEILGFLGPNGAGKTTTLRILCGYQPPSAGDASINGHDLTRESLEARRHIGYLPENFCAPPELRVGEYLRYRARLKGLGRRQANLRAVEMMEKLELTTRARQLFSQLSKGFRQRVGLADALLADPACLLLDEPFGGLDPLQRQEFRSLLRKLANQGKAVLFSSHVLPEVEEMADRILILDQGKLVLSGDCAELLQRAQRACRLLIEVEPGTTSISEDLVADFPGIEVEQLGDGKIMLSSKQDLPRSKLFKWLAARNEDVLSFANQQADLDSLFRSILESSNQSATPSKPAGTGADRQ